MSWKHLMIRFGVAAIALAAVIAAVTFWPRVDIAGFVEIRCLDLLDAPAVSVVESG